MQTDLVSVIEAAYLIEQSEDAWLKGILRAAGTSIGAGAGVAAFTYDASNPAAFRFHSFVYEDMSEEVAALALRAVPASDADFVRESFMSRPCATSSEVPGWYQQPFVENMRRDFGIHDTLTINGINPNGHGCAVVAFMPRKTTLNTGRRNVLQKISCHLAAACRLRRVLSLTDAPLAGDAIVDYQGRIRHAEGKARSKTSLSSLKESTVAILNSRTHLRRTAPEQAVDEWKGLIAARWTLIDVQETDGRKYLVARENKPRIKGPKKLTEREQQVVALAAIGHHNKLIGYFLGISHSTVRVLMARAAGKLEVRSRAELIRCHFDALGASSREKVDHPGRASGGRP